MTYTEAIAVQQRIARLRPTCVVVVRPLSGSGWSAEWVVDVTNKHTKMAVTIIIACDWDAGLCERV